MKLIEAAYAVGASAGDLVERVHTAPAIVVVFMAVLGLALAILLVMWLFLPFAVYGVKRRLDEQTAAIEALREQLSRMPAAAPPERTVGGLSLPSRESESGLHL